MRTSLKRALSALLILSLALSLAAPIFAEEEPYRYVAIGDSTTNGFGLPGFVYQKSGRFCEIPETYIYRMCDYLRTRGKNVEFTNLSLTGLRINELVTFLDETVTKEDADAYGRMHWEEYMYDDYDSPEELRSAYISAVQGADLITVDLGSNNFANYMLARVAELFGIDIGFRWGYADEHFNDLMEKNDIDISLKLKNSVTKLVEDVTKGAVTEDMIAGIVDAFLYAYAYFIIGFRDAMRLIYGFNDHAEVIVLGIGNLLDGMSASYNSVVIDLGALWAGFMQIANTYIMDLNEYHTKYKYANITSVESIMQAVARGQRYPGLPDEMLNLFYSDTMLGKEGAAAFIGELAGGAPVSLEDAKAAYAAQLEESPLTAAVNHVIDTFYTAAGYAEPLDLAAGAPLLIESGTSGLGPVLTEAFTDYDNASELAKGLTHMMYYMMHNAAGAHPSEYGHEQKLNAVIRAYETCVPAVGAHAVNLFYSVHDFFRELLRSPRKLRTIADALINAVAALFPIRISF